MKTELTFIRRLFEINSNSFQQYLKKSKAIKADATLWSNSFLNFCPFQSEMEELPFPKIYKKKPVRDSNTIMTRKIANQMYYATQIGNENWGTEFYLYNYSNEIGELLHKEDRLLYFTDKTMNFIKENSHVYNSFFKVRLFFNDQNDDEKIKLSQVEFIELNSLEMVQKKIFYLYDGDAEEETYMVDIYSYNDDNEIDSIERNGFYENENNILDTRTFRFEFINDKIVIYSKQKKRNGTFNEQQIYPVLIDL